MTLPTLLLKLSGILHYLMATKVPGFKLVHLGFAHSLQPSSAGTKYGFQKTRVTLKETSSFIIWEWAKLTYFLEESNKIQALNSSKQLSLWVVGTQATHVIHSVCFLRVKESGRTQRTFCSQCSNAFPWILIEKILWPPENYSGVLFDTILFCGSEFIAQPHAFESEGPLKRKPLSSRVIALLPCVFIFPGDCFATLCHSTIPPTLPLPSSPHSLMSGGPEQGEGRVKPFPKHYWKWAHIRTQPQYSSRKLAKIKPHFLSHLEWLELPNPCTRTASESPENHKIKWLLGSSFRIKHSESIFNGNKARRTHPNGFCNVWVRFLAGFMGVAKLSRSSVISCVREVLEGTVPSIKTNIQWTEDEYVARSWTFSFWIN